MIETLDDEKVIEGLVLFDELPSGSRETSFNARRELTEDKSRRPDRPTS